MATFEELTFYDKVGGMQRLKGIVTNSVLKVHNNQERSI
jgi:hypothetical protein